MPYKSPVNDLIGLDIGITSIKLVELTGKSARDARVTAWSRLFMGTPEQPMSGGLPEPEILAKHIRLAVMQSGSKSRNAAISVGGAAAITKIIRLVNLSENDMMYQIEAEIDRHIAYKADDIYFDFEVVGPSASTQDLVDVILSAARKDHTDHLLAAVEQAGLQCELIDLAPYALERVGRLFAQDQSCYGIVDIGELATNLYAFDKQGVMIFSREVESGVQRLLTAICHAYGMNMLEADQSIMDNNLPSDFSSEILHPFLSQIGQNINRMLQFYYSASGELPAINTLWLAGEGAYLDGVAHVVQNAVGLPVALIDPFEKTASGTRNLAAGRRLSPSLSLATGLAMRSFDQ